MNLKPLLKHKQRELYNTVLEPLERFLKGQFERLDHRITQLEERIQFMEDELNKMADPNDPRIQSMIIELDLTDPLVLGKFQLWKKDDGTVLGLRRILAFQKERSHGKTN